MSRPGSHSGAGEYGCGYYPYFGSGGSRGCSGKMSLSPSFCWPCSLLQCSEQWGHSQEGYQLLQGWFCWWDTILLASKYRDHPPTIGPPPHIAQLPFRLSFGQGLPDLWGQSSWVGQIVLRTCPK